MHIKNFRLQQDYYVSFMTFITMARVRLKINISMHSIVMIDFCAIMTVAINFMHVFPGFYMVKHRLLFIHEFSMYPS